MRLDKAWLVFRKDWREIKRNKEVMLPIIILPVIFSVVVPLILASTMAGGDQSDKGFEALMKILPPDVTDVIAGMTPAEGLVYIGLTAFMLPFFFIIPLMASSVISSDSFAGEKERKTIEGLLATPLSDAELLLGKIMVSFIPSMAITIIAFAAFSSLVVGFFYISFGTFIAFPTLTWMAAIFLVSPSLAFVGIGLTVIISAKVKGYREAQQLSALTIVPILALLFSQAAGVLFITTMVLLAITVLLLAIGTLVFFAGLRMFAREEILSKMT